MTDRCESILRLAALLAVLSLTPFGGLACEQAGDNTSEETEQTETTDTPSAAEINQFVEEALKEAPHAEARAWLADSRNMLFEGDRDYVKKLVEDFYAAGASDVRMTGISEIGGRQVSASFVVFLPTDASARARCFEIYNRYNTDMGEDAEKDVGAKYLFLSFD